jgi:phosphonate transport system substrate-binding protein
LERPHLLARRDLGRLAAALACVPIPNSPARARVRPVRFGLTPVFLDSDFELIRDLERYLAEALGAPVQLVKRRTYQEVLALLLAGQLEAAWICGYPYVQYADRLAILGIPVHRGRPLYQSYLIADARTPFTSLDELRGRSHAFSDPDSNSGFLVTRWLLAQRGEIPERWFSRFFFTYGHRNVIRAVGAGLADSGSVDGYVWEVMAEREPELTDRTRVLARSDWHGFPPVCCLADAREGRVARALAAALAAMPETEAGARVLATLHLDGFVPGGPALFEGIARMSAAVRAAA